MAPAPILTAETVPAYCKERATEIGRFGADAELTAKAIMGGNVNYAFVVEEAATGKTAFVKQAPEFVAVFGPDGFPLTSARMQLEIDVYNAWRKILGPEGAARFLPEIYHFDKMNMVFVMEFLAGCDLLDKRMVTVGKVSEATGASLGEFMGITHAATHNTKLPKEQADALVKDYENRPMRDIQLEFVFTKAYKETTPEERAGLDMNEAFLKEIEALKAAYNGACTETGLVLSHGDLHPGSIMVDEDSGKVKIIDPEFTVYGPPGLDVGSVLSGFVLAAVHHAHEKGPESAAAVGTIKTGSAAVWKSYSDAMTKGGIPADVVQKIGVETVGFTVAEVCRTALGKAGDRKWLQFEDKDKKAAAVKCALGIVERCMTGRHTGGMEMLLKELDALVA
eukprot:TRINITY_DN83500_c0_g1_i1.p1 TRINITY_DN83500_c0_g1~~TRINITY_DN83500_c0_g1_i1.p1  ORF type:complete len:394 (-),score=136.26 TRINITY_DN83500_c0_g1_i1:436-1617(-)